MTRDIPSMILGILPIELGVLKNIIFQEIRGRLSYLVQGKGYKE
jgi:hypothetical protein